MVAKKGRSTTAERVTKTKVDTIEVTPESVKEWIAPLFQRPIKINQKVIELSEKIKEDGVIPGVITLGVLNGKTYLIDGQHRREAFNLSRIDIAYVDVRYMYFEDPGGMGLMGEEYIRLNSYLVRIKPDDILRGMESGSEALQIIRQRCPFVGYDQIRRGKGNPILSMSQLLRCWYGSQSEVPVGTGFSVTSLIPSLTIEEAEAAATFANICLKAWGKDVENARLWSGLSFTLCAWLYRRSVLAQYSQRSMRLTKELFVKCLMALSADQYFIDWLVGRTLRERDRGLAYVRLKTLFAKRIQLETGMKTTAILPQPSWAGK